MPPISSSRDTTRIHFTVSVCGGRIVFTRTGPPHASLLETNRDIFRMRLESVGASRSCGAVWDFSRSNPSDRSFNTGYPFGLLTIVGGEASRYIRHSNNAAKPIRSVIKTQRIASVLLQRAQCDVVGSEG